MLVNHIATDMKNSDLIMNEAEIIALEALRFLASAPDRFSRFLTLTGLSQRDLQLQAGDPEFLASVMDYLLSEEKLLLEFAETASLDPQLIISMRTKLPGAPRI